MSSGLSSIGFCTPDRHGGIRQPLLSSFRLHSREQMHKARSIKASRRVGFLKWARYSFTTSLSPHWNWYKPDCLIPLNISRKSLEVSGVGDGQLLPLTNLPGGSICRADMILVINNDQEGLHEGIPVGEHWSVLLQQGEAQSNTLPMRRLTSLWD